jgi:hypothetical protein
MTRRPVSDDLALAECVDATHRLALLPGYYLQRRKVHIESFLGV